MADAQLDSFSGINNVLTADQLPMQAFAAASNVDLDLAGKPARRAGFAQASPTDHRNVWQAAGFTLATRGAAGDLVNVDTSAVLAPGLGHTPRVWYANLPDGRTIYSNGVTAGIVSAAAATPWGVPIPATVGAAANAVGQLFPGKYQWSVSFVRQADNLEGAPKFSQAFVDITTGGVSFTGLPTLAGYRTNIYLTSQFGGTRYLIGSTTNGTLAFAGANKDLQRHCKTEFMAPPPAGTLVGFWRGRTLVASGNTLFGSLLHSWELFDLFKDFKPFSAPITLLVPLEGGIWVGTTKELLFLAGSTWDNLVPQRKLEGAVVLGSGIHAPGEHIRFGEGRGAGTCMLGIANGSIVAGSPDGALSPITQDVYRTAAAEVWATFRMVGTAPNQFPQYIAQVL